MIADILSGISRISPASSFDGSSKTFLSHRSSIEPTSHLFLLRSLGGSGFNERLGRILSTVSLFSKESSEESSSGSPGLLTVVFPASLPPQGNSLIFTRLDLLLAVGVPVVSV